MVVENVVNPAMYSEAECLFLIENLGKPPLVALREVNASDAINIRAVQPLLQRVYELAELEAMQGEKWAGVEAVRNAFSVYLEHFRSWRSEKRRGAPKWPSLYTFPPKGRPIRGGPQADAGIVRTYFDKNGNRKSFEIDLVPSETPLWEPIWEGKDDSTGETGVLVNHDLNRIECFCGHTIKFRAGERSSYNAARARLSKHLRSAREDAEKHRLVYALEFGS